MSPYEKMTKTKPNLSHVRVFGTMVIVKDNNNQIGKLSDNCSIGIFLRFTGTDRNIVFYDTTTHQARQDRYVDFDESYFHESRAPPYAQKLKKIAETALVNKEIEEMFIKHGVPKLNGNKQFASTSQRTDDDKVFNV